MYFLISLLTFFFFFFELVTCLIEAEVSVLFTLSNKTVLLENLETFHNSNAISENSTEIPAAELLSNTY